MAITTRTDKHTITSAEAAAGYVDISVDIGGRNIRLWCAHFNVNYVSNIIAWITATRRTSYDPKTAGQSIVLDAGKVTNDLPLVFTGPVRLASITSVHFVLFQPTAGEVLDYSLSYEEI